MSEDKGNCEVCGGTGKMMHDSTCPYCNGTGEWTQAGMSYKNNHICQCITLDRRFCPICGLECHHDTTLNPKQVIDDGYGGLGASKGTTDYSIVDHENTEEIVIT